MPSLVTRKPAGYGRRLSTLWKRGAVGFLSLMAAGAAWAQDDQVGKYSVESDFRFSIFGSSEFKERSTRGSIDGYELGSKDVLSMKVGEGFLIRLGLDVDRFNYSTTRTAALPSKLQTAAAVVGVDLQLGEAWLLRVEAEPGFYSGSVDIRARSFDVPIIIGASYCWSADLQLVAGLSIDPERKYPVLPGVGFRYKISADWVADFILPTPRLEYTFNKSILLYAGGDVKEGSYRMDGNFGTSHGEPKLDDSVTDFTQIRVGGGASWKLNQALSLELEAGVVPLQEFDFHRAEIKARSTEIPPYGAVVLKAAF